MPPKIRLYAFANQSTDPDDGKRSTKDVDVEFLEISSEHQFLEKLKNSDKASTRGNDLGPKRVIYQ